MSRRVSLPRCQPARFSSSPGRHVAPLALVAAVAAARVVDRLRGGHEDAGIPMKRMHFLEISDEPWCPRGIRRGVTDFCRFVTEHSGLFNAVAPLLADAI